MSTTPLAQAAGRPFLDPGWVLRNGGLLWDRAVEHLLLTGVSVAIGLVLSLLLSAAALRWRRLYAPIAEISGVLYTVPSLAAFALLWPLLGGVRRKFLIGVIALTSYTILILVRNIVTGIQGVPRDVREAAVGMGYRPVQRFLRVELPLALPTIVAGVRIATVTVVGLVTVTALIGMGGFGALILNGIRLPFPTQVVVGIVASVLLAAAVDYALLRVERRLTPWLRTAV